VTTTVGAESPGRRWWKVRVSPSIFLLLAGYFCIQSGFEETWAGKIVTNFRLTTLMFFLFSWLLPLMAIIAATYQLIRHRSVQHAVEIALAVWLLIRAFSLIIKA
jgi:hypothetical protein